MSRSKILVVCPFPQGVAAGQRLKYEQYLDIWRAEGFDVDVEPFMSLRLWTIAYKKGHLLEKVFWTVIGELRRVLLISRLPAYDLVYVFMYVTPFGTSIFEKLYRWAAKKLVFDVEDNVMVQKGNQVNWISRFIRGRDKYTCLIKTADHVITSSTFLNDDCLRLNQKKACTYISSSIETDRYVMAQRYNNDKAVAIGWTGTFSSLEYLELLRPVFLELKNHRRFKLVVIGNFDYEFPEMDMGLIQWTKAKEIEDLQRIDIGVYPLPLTEWVLGKSGLKALQYMAMGIPAVASDVGSSPIIIQHMKNGCLVKTQDEWLSTLIQLIDDPTLRQRLGQAGRKTVESTYSTAVISSQYLGVLGSTLERTDREEVVN